MGHIFISYSHKEYVEKLEQTLVEKGFDVWIDHRIDYGSQWPKEIQIALDSCTALKPPAKNTKSPTAAYTLTGT